MEREKAIFAGAGMAIAVFAFWFICYNKTRFIERDLSSEKLKTERLLAEKLQADKSMEKSLNQITSLEADKINLLVQIEQRNDQLSKQVSSYRRMKEDLLKVEDQLASEVESRKRLANLNRQAGEQYTSISTEWQKLHDSLQYFSEQNRYLGEQLAKSTLQSIDQTLVTPLKKNDKRITVRARAARKLVAHVRVPSALENMTFSVEGPRGNEVGNQETITSHIINSQDEYMTASLADQPITDMKTKTLEIVYAPKSKLESGVYKIKIFNDGQYVGIMQVKLK